MPRFRWLAIAAAYWAAHFVGYLFLIPEQRVSPVWPASGVGLALLLVRPRSEWRTLVVVLGAVTFASNLVLSRSLGLSLGFTLANTLELAVGAMLILHPGGGSFSLRTVRDVLRLLLVATVWTAVPALVGAATASLQGAAFALTYLTWWTSDSLGILLLAPFVLSWSRPEPVPREVGRCEACLHVAAWGFTAWLVLRGGNSGLPLVPQPYLLLPLVAWTAIRLGGRGVTAALLGMMVLAVVGLRSHSDAFKWGMQSDLESLLATQLYLAAAAVQGLLLAASTGEMTRLERLAREDQARLQQAHAEAASNAMWLRLALDAARMGTWEWDAKTNDVRWSEGVEDIFGVPRGSFGGTYEAYLALVHPDDRAMVSDHIAATLRGERDDYHVEHRFLTPDGTVLWLEGKGRVLRDAAGRATGMRGSAVEITARKAAQAELFASEELLKHFIQHTPAAVAMFDNQMRYLHVAERWLTDYHLERQDVIGRSHYEVFPDIPERWKQVHARVLQGAVESCAEDPFPRADGTTEWLHWEVRPWRKAGGEIGGLIMFTQVITERIRAEEAKRKSERRLRTLIEHASDLITVINGRGVIRFQSPSSKRVLGRDPSELLGTSVLDLTHPDDLPEARRKLAAALTPGPQPVTIKLRMRHLDGSYRLFECVGRSVPEEAEEGFIVVNSRDITESTSLQEQLRQAQKLEALGTLAGGIAHDFNNILGAMLAFTEVARCENPENAQLQGCLDEVTRAGRRATDLVRQILSFSRRQPQDRKPIALGPVIEEALALLRSTLPATITLDARLADGVPAVSADPTQVHQVLMNLCTNAAHAMTGRGSLRIGLDTFRVETGSLGPHPKVGPGDYVRLVVEDNGRGMDPATVGRIFEPFFTTKQPGEGTGLGLAVVHGIIEEHDGAITVTSEPGVGTAFSIYLPVTLAPNVSPVQRHSIAPPGQGKKVLFVDDEPALCEAGKRLLRRGGYEVVACVSPAEALGLFKAEPNAFALVVSDLTMPSMTGVELAAKIHAHRPELPILLVSGYPGKLGADVLRDVGVREVLQKPLDGAALLAGVGRLTSAAGAPAPKVA